MDTQVILTFLQESLFLIVIFIVFLGYAMLRGKQSLMNLILGLYFALLISLNFPYYSTFLSGAEADKLADSTILLVIFFIFTLFSTYIFGKITPLEYGNTAFEDFSKKLIFALLATILVMAYSFNVLPVTDIITPGTPIQTLFAPAANFFWWLLIPFIALIFL